MKIVNVFCVLGLGWMVLSFFFVINGFYFEDWTFPGPIIKTVEAIQANLELIDQDRRIQETVSSLSY